MALIKLKAPKKRPETKKAEFESYWDERPSLNFSDKELPDSKNWEVGSEQTIVVKVKVESKRQEENEPSKVTLRVVSVGMDTDHDDK